MDFTYTYINHFMAGYCRTKEVLFFSQVQMRRSEAFCTVIDPTTKQPRLDTLRRLSSDYDRNQARLLEHEAWEVRDRQKVENLFAQFGFQFKDGYSFETISLPDTHDPYQFIEPVAGNSAPVILTNQAA